MLIDIDFNSISQVRLHSAPQILFLSRFTTGPKRHQ